MPRRNPTKKTWLIVGGSVALVAATGVTAWLVTRDRPEEGPVDGWVNVPPPPEQDAFVMFEVMFYGRPGVREGSVPGTLPKQGPKAKATTDTIDEPQRVGGPPPLPPPTGKPTGATDPMQPGVSTGKASIKRLPKPQTFKGWKFRKSYGPFRGQAYSVYVEHGAKGWRWGITGVGPSAGMSSKYWAVSRKTAMSQAEGMIRLGFGWFEPVSAATLKTISRNDVLFDNTWVMS